MKPVIATLILWFSVSILFAQEGKRELKIDKHYVNLPVDESAERQQMTFLIDGEVEREFVIRLSDGEPDYWVFADMSPYQGKKLSIKYPVKVKGLKAITQSDQFAGQDSLYAEKNRPQFHFSSRRGWNNDPNGLVYYKGTYHLYYQHNPYEANWENMHWGHAYGTDLLHWTEVTDVMFPDELGTIFSGTAAVDHRNTSGFQTGDDPPIIAAYTAHNSNNGDAIQTQCIAYSNDGGMTFTKYEGNPVIDSKPKWKTTHTRDPKIFWHEESQKWVMVLFEKDGHSFYNSDNLKEWTYLSHLIGFWECPELFELPVDGNRYNTKWVIYGASGTYMIGDFDGREFTPESGKHRYVSGGLYAAQTYNDIPESDGRRIQFGWGQIVHEGMPFKHMMLFPVSLSLHSTPNGIRMFSNPIEEVETLHKKSHRWTNLTPEEANEKLKAVEGDLFHIKTKLKIIDRTAFELQFNGNRIANYTMNHNKLNGEFFENFHADQGTIELEILVDRTSIEIYAEGGAFNLIETLPVDKNEEGLQFLEDRAEIEIQYLEVHEMKSVWSDDS